MLEKLVELLEPYMSGEPCDAESGSCELTNCRTCDAIALANRLILHDVVPVVRCKDCQYFLKAEVNGNGFLICQVTDKEIFEEDFCSYGERKDGDV